MARAGILCAFFAASSSFFPNAALAQETSAFSYDALGRLTTVSKTGGVNSGISVSTTYDAAGNRSNYSVIGAVTTVSVAPAIANEGTSLSFIVSRLGATGGPSSVAWSTSNGTAIAGNNYTASSGTASFAPGVTSATVTVPTLVDNVVTGDLAMAVNLSSPSGAVLGTSSASGTIRNTDGPPTLTVSGASANEGSPLSFVVTRAGSLNALTVGYATSNGTGVAGTNYTSTSGTLSFGVGQMTATVSVPTINDNIYTGNLGLTLALSSPSGAVLGTPSSATGTIVNTTAQAQLSIANASANEGSPLSFVVTRTGSINAASVNYATSDVSAVAGTNYTSQSGTLNFAAGATSATITVPTQTDSVYTGNLGMTIALSSPSGAVLGTSSATGTIVNTTAQAQLSITGASANEGSPLSFVVNRTGSIHAVTVNYATSNGSAVAGTNYVNSSGTLNLAAGATSATVTVPTINDYTITGNLGMTVTLSAPSSGATISTPTASGTIVNINSGWTAMLSSANWSSCGPGYCFTFKGYSTSSAKGSLTPNNFNGKTIKELYWLDSISGITFTMSATTLPPNSGWTSLYIPGTGLLQRSAAYYNTSGTNATWSWYGVAGPSSGAILIQ